MISLQELTAKRDRLDSLLGPFLRPDGFAEFSQLIENANKACSTDPDRAEKLRSRAEQMEAQVERSAQAALLSEITLKLSCCNLQKKVWIDTTRLSRSFRNKCASRNGSIWILSLKSIDAFYFGTVVRLVFATRACLGLR